MAAALTMSRPTCNRPGRGPAVRKHPIHRQIAVTFQPLQRRSSAVWPGERATERRGFSGGVAARTVSIAALRSCWTPPAVDREQKPLSGSSVAPTTIRPSRRGMM